MSTQQIIQLEEQELSQEIDKVLTTEAKNLIFYENYLLGKGVNVEKVKHLIRLQALLCNERCVISNNRQHIKEQINYWLHKK